ncbi:MAG: phosphate signaling complex protein PhoU [Synergistetes bacterium]|nr:MAG: Phosphate-specific transport system accessory protein PhoU [bacterium 42_11]MBC7331512.1 phosphate signaling complex protein PhoU [Synergistota bacterium]MDK2870800.1 phosphate transport system protein [bacterium]
MGLNIRASLEEDLRDLEEKLLRLASLSKDALSKAMKALVHQDQDLANEVINSDDFLDDLTIELDRTCVEVIARRHPLARDLRTITTIMKMIVDLERVGDLAVNIARIVLAIGKEPFVKPLIDLPRMAEHAQKMLDMAIEAFLERSVEKAYEVCKMDNMLDDLERQIVSELFFLMLENPGRTLKQGVQLMFVARHLERVGDHTTNLAEKVIYMITGELVRSSEIR